MEKKGDDCRTKMVLKDKKDGIDLLNWLEKYGKISIVKETHLMEE